MKTFHWIPRVLAIVTIFAASSGNAAQNYDKAISENVFQILNELKYSGALQDRSIAVFGFCDAQGERGCEALTHSIADKIMNTIHMYKMASGIPFSTVARKDLLAIEIEYFISSSDKDKVRQEAMDLLKPSDLLFTGTWQDGDGNFDLNLKVLKVGRQGTETVAFKQVTVDKAGMSGELLDCFKKRRDNQGQTPGSVQNLQEKINEYDRQIEEIRKRQKSAEREKDMLNTLAEKKKIVERLSAAPGKGVAYTDRKYDENMAFINVETTPSSDMDIYIDGVWVSRSPLKLYEIEAGEKHTITIKGDPRYFKEFSVERTYKKFYRAVETFEIERGIGKILPLAEEPIEKVVVDGVELPFDPRQPQIEVPAGLHKIKVFSGFLRGSFEEDVWIGDCLYREISMINLCDVSSGPPEEFEKESWSGVEFVWVPGGCFEMGCGNWDDSCQKNEEPVHKVALEGFWMGKYEVTQAQWKTVMGDNPSQSRKGGDYPVENVSWEGAMAFIRKLNERTGRRFRLPTEAQWEYACRSGGKNEVYCGGKDLNAVAWHEKNSGDAIHPVGTKAANGLGLYDMSGNVWEWCSDWYAAEYDSRPVVLPAGPSEGSGRVLRGGAIGKIQIYVHRTGYSSGYSSGYHWETIVAPGSCRSAERYSFNPSAPQGTLGFRLVLNPDC